MSPTITEGYLPGCIGRIAQLHAGYYAPRHRFGVAFEARVARELADFCLACVPGRDGLWLAQEQGEHIVGSIAIDGSRVAQDGQAHLRWFITADSIRGTGVGKRLLQAALGFCDACGYPSVYLWTFAGLDAARHLYESCGFRLVQESEGTQWGTAVTEQRFVRACPAVAAAHAARR